MYTVTSCESVSKLFCVNLMCGHKHNLPTLTCPISRKGYQYSCTHTMCTCVCGRCLEFVHPNRDFLFRFSVGTPPGEVHHNEWY